MAHIAQHFPLNVLIGTSLIKRHEAVNMEMHGDCVPHPRKEGAPIVQQNEGRFIVAVVISQRPEDGQANKNSGIDWGIPSRTQPLLRSYWQLLSVGECAGSLSAAVINTLTESSSGKERIYFPNTYRLSVRELSTGTYAVT